MLIVSDIKFHAPDEVKPLAKHRYLIALRINGLTFRRAFFKDKKSAGSSYITVIKALNYASRQLSDKIDIVLYDRRTIIAEVELPIDSFALGIEQSENHEEYAYLYEYLVDQCMAWYNDYFDRKEKKRKIKKEWKMMERSCQRNRQRNIQRITCLCAMQ